MKPVAALLDGPGHAGTDKTGMLNERRSHWRDRALPSRRDCRHADSARI
jgi:hypothetical protein